MTEFFQLSAAERLDALNAVANTSGLMPHLLEKDIWVAWSLQHLFTGPYAEHLVFKGGTSLSKAYGRKYSNLYGINSPRLGSGLFIRTRGNSRI